MRFFVAAVGLGVAAGATTDHEMTAVSGTCAMTQDGSIDWQFEDAVDGNTGWDFTKGSLKYNGSTGNLAIELECTANGQWGPCGDADGDGDPDSATADDFGIDYIDESKLGGQEAITCALYFDSAALPSVAIGVHSGGEGFVLASFDNAKASNHKNIHQEASFGAPTATTATIQYPSTVASGTKTNLMFTIADARLLPGWSAQGAYGLRLKCFAGSLTDKVGEDFIGTAVVPIDQPVDCKSTCDTPSQFACGLDHYSKPAGTQCATTGCASNECCTPLPVCADNAAICGTHTAKTSPAKCASTGCTQADCCVTPTCASFVANCPKGTEKKDGSASCSTFECSESDCCVAVEEKVAPSPSAPSPSNGGGGGGGGCHPQCKWLCDDPVCPAKCHPVCARPKCQMDCKPAECAKCEVHCEEPVCSVRCPKEMCEMEDCPACETICRPAVCRTTCTAPEPNCSPMCNKTKCAWKCKTPELCPKPKCQLTCEKPACDESKVFGALLETDAHLTRSDSCCDCKDAASAHAAIKSANMHAADNDISLTDLPSVKEVRYAESLLQQGGKATCCPC